MITEKLLRLGRGYSSQNASSEVVQLAGEGVDQLDTYFGAYLPQFFYAMAAPLCLFAAMCFIPDERLWDALERVRLADFFKSENGLDTLLSERAANLSGGQRQRLALARGILHDSAVYIFDEATSNIDSESEECILSEIQRMAKEKCVIMISHRLANVHNADRIYVLENGVIAENGHHSQIIESGGLYSRLHKAQSELEQLGGAV